MSLVGIWDVAIKYHLGTMTVTPVAFPDQSLAAGAVLLPVVAAEAPPGTCPRLGRDVVVAVPV